MGSQALAVAAATPGVTEVQPVETSSVRYNGQAYVALGLDVRPLYSYRLSAGHWFTTADTAAGAGTSIPAVVLGPAWAFGELLGWLIYQRLLALLPNDVALSRPRESSPVIPLIAFAGGLALTRMLIRGPLRRAVQIQPGTALRCR